MALFSPFWMNKDTKKEFDIVEKVEKIKDEGKLLKIAREAPIALVRSAAYERLQSDSAHEKVASDPAYESGFRVKSGFKASAADPSFDRSKYYDAVESVITYSIDRDVFKMAVGMTDDPDVLEGRYDKISRNELEMKYMGSMLPVLRGRLDALMKEKMSAGSDRNALYRILRSDAYSECLKNEAMNMMIGSLKDDGSRAEFIRNCDAPGTKGHPDIVEKIESREVLASLAADESVAIISRHKAATLAGLKTPFGSKTFICHNCGAPVIFDQRYEKTSNESYNTVAEFCCRNGCWNNSNAIPGRDIIKEAGDAFDDLLEDVILVCPDCFGQRGYTSAEPHMKKCNCPGKAAPIPVKASIQPW
ncbi:MAG: hypothetical protein K6G43_00415 [Lachnospiraceae bacterium]|nr:hypothetical protein [Lachnospiraceae bacterium]